MKYQELPAHSRVWIYQSDRLLSESEVADINARAEEFISNWNAHGSSLSAAFTLVDNLFLIFFVDESKAKASGCSIDSSVGFIKHIEKRFNLDLFNRLNIAYEVDGELGIAKMADFQQLLSEGKLTKNTIVFNNLVSTKEEFENGWKTTVSNSWHAKLLA